MVGAASGILIETTSERSVECSMKNESKQAAGVVLAAGLAVSSIPALATGYQGAVQECGAQLQHLADGPEGLHRAVGSQLIYNRLSHQSLFLGALTSDRMITHAYSEPGTYSVRVIATGLDAVTSEKQLTITVTGEVHTTFVPAEKQRLVN